MMADLKTAQLSRVYGVAQTVLLLGFAGAIVLDHSAPLVIQQYPGYADYKRRSFGLMPPWRG